MKPIALAVINRHPNQMVSCMYPWRQIASSGVSGDSSPDRVVAHVLASCVSTVQLVDDAVTPEVYAALRRDAPAVKIVQVVHVVDRGSVDRALAAAPLVDALLLDSGNPAAAVRELGGTGRVHDWHLSREIVERSGRPVFLAGGLRSANVAEALRAVRPHGVDICSGVRTEGRLDEAKLTTFVAALGAA